MHLKIINTLYLYFYTLNMPLCDLSSSFFSLCLVRLESELKSKQERIEELKKEFDEKIYSLEKQAVLDKDRYNAIALICTFSYYYIILGFGRKWCQKSTRLLQSFVKSQTYKWQTQQNGLYKKTCQLAASCIECQTRRRSL